MDLLLVIIGFTGLLAGVLGSFLPVLPGPASSWLGLLCLYVTAAIPANYTVIGITLGLAVVLSVLDYVIPAKGTKMVGGSTYGIWGTNIGLVVGILAPIPFGFILGPFLGALLGELLFDAKDRSRALKAALGALIGLLLSGFLQFIVSIVYFGWGLGLLWKYKAMLF